MKIFETSTDSQSVLLTPRCLSNNYELYVQNEDTKEEIKYTSITPPPIGERLMVKTILNTVSLILDFTFETINNTSYRLKLICLETGNIVWRGKAFATSQDTQKYKINV